MAGNLRQEAVIESKLPSRKEITSRLINLFFLLIVLGLLIYLYQILSRPPQVRVAPYKTPGLTTLFSIYGYGSKPDELLSKPHGVAFDKTGKIYITDTSNHRILVFNKRGKYLFKFGKEGRKKGEFMFPLNVAVSSQGKIYVTMMAQNKMHIYSPKGKFLKEVSLDRPIALTIRGKKLYIATAGEILVADLEGNILKKWGKEGKNVGEFEYPNGIGLDKKGNILVSDTNNDRIQIFKSNGKLVGLKGEPPESLNDPNRLFGLGTGLTLDSKERVYVVDTFHHAIRVFDHDGNDFGELGRTGEGEGQFNYPSTIAYAGGQKFVVADQGNNRVQVVKLTPPIKKPKPPARPVGRPLTFWIVLGTLTLLLASAAFFGLRKYLKKPAS